jgi:uncharacterized protein (TIGR02646 family)
MEPVLPFCLSSYRQGVNDWSDLSRNSAHITELWKYIDAMQKGFCAYCECALERKHIEHFKPRNKYPRSTFIWANLFGSCGDSSKTGGWSRCGIYKDNGADAYNIGDLLKPDEDDPSKFLRFLTTGKIVPRSGLSEFDKKRAQTTINILNLNNNTALYNSRKTAIGHILDQVIELYELQDQLELNDWEDFLAGELQSIIGLEFETALEHAFRYNMEFPL